MVTELKPSNGRKSFGGKALVVSDGRRTALLSYGTVVCWTDASLNLHRTWDGWSATTGAHVTAFCDDLGVPYKGKADWTNLKVEETPSWTKLLAR